MKGIAVPLALGLLLATAPLARSQEPGEDPEVTRARVEQILAYGIRAASAVRGLPLPEGSIPYVFLEKDAFGEFLRDLAFEGRDRGALDRQEGFLSALRLLPADGRLEALHDEIPWGGAVLLYDFTQDRFLVGRGFEEWGWRSAPSTVHEAVHWLEERNLGLAFEARSAALAGDDDALLAHRSLVEGTAAVATIEVFLAERERRLDSFEGPIGTVIRGNARRHGYGPGTSGPERFGPYVDEALVAPYAEGANFVQELRRGLGWAAFDRRVYPAPPVSMEQILHPARYLAGEAPVAIEIPPELDQVVGGDWTPLGSSTAGELTLRLLAGAAAAEGWGGDRYRVYRDPAGRTLLVWAIEFDTVEDAVEFGRAFPHIAREQTIRARKRSVIVAAPEGALSEALFGTISSLFD